MEAKNTLEYKMFFISFMFLNSKLRELKIPVSQCIKVAPMLLEFFLSEWPFIRIQKSQNNKSQNAN